ncbi:MAG: hypothetical protein K9N46_15820, partial [Candidatus Marinimicrobia bacterium]|nr:hypothetical protein [Candidatus Neomarinimicrobiota bacterium]
NSLILQTDSVKQLILALPTVAEHVYEMNYEARKKIGSLPSVKNIAISLWDASTQFSSLV